MRQAIGDVVAVAVAAAISPFPIIGVIAMLITPRAKANGVIFVVGWLVGLATVGVIGLAAAGAIDGGDDATDAGVDPVRLVLGAASIGLAARQWSKRPAPDVEPELPAWMSAAERITAVRAAGLGVAMSAINPKNLVLTLAATSSIGGAGLSTGDEIVVFVVYAAIASLGVATPLAVYLGAGSRGPAILEDMRSWLVRNNATITTIVFLVIGAVMLGQGIGG